MALNVGEEMWHRLFDRFFFYFEISLLADVQSKLQTSLASKANILLLFCELFRSCLLCNCGVLLSFSLGAGGCL